jgi:hypothetical protein
MFLLKRLFNKNLPADAFQQKHASRHSSSTNNKYAGTLQHFNIITCQ